MKVEHSENDQSACSSERKAIAVLYTCVFAFLSILFLVMLYDPIVSALPETDLWWMIPTLVHYVDGKPFGDVFSFLISPSPIMLGQPALKMYLFLVSSLFGFQTKYFIFASITIHFLNSGLLFLLSKNFGLGTRISLFSALTYLTIFPHFHSYIWPTAAQHIIGLFFILLVLNLYLTTDRLIRLNKRHRWYFILTLVMGVLASFQRSTLIAPMLILTHILVCSGGDEDRIKKYDTWLPLFIIYLIYPLAALTFVGDVILTTSIAKMPYPATVKFLLLLLVGMLCLFLMRGLLRAYPRYKGLGFSKSLSRAVILSALLVVYLVLSLRDIRNLLLPYNMLVPFTSVLATFLEPLQKVFLIDSTQAYHVIPPQIGVFSVLLGLLLVGIFVRAFVFENRQLVLIVCWYLFALAHLLFQYSSYPVYTPSRYFVYISPLFSIMFCSVFIYLYTGFTNKTRLGRVTKEVSLALIFIAVLIPNILAIKLEMFRGKLVNTYFVYDYVRTATLISDDIVKSHHVNRVQLGAIYVNNVVEMPIRELWKDVSPADPGRYDNFRLIVGEVLDHQFFRRIRVNQSETGVDGDGAYELRDDRIANSRDDNIDPFARLFADAVARMDRGRNQEAIDLLQKAIERRPFLLTYMLGTQRLEDLRWITNGVPVRTWIDKIAKDMWGGIPTRKHQYIVTLMNKEISDYILCLFYISYLEHLAGNVEESKHWLSQIHFLEADSEGLSSWIGKVPIVRSNERMLSFLEHVHETSYFRNALPWGKDDYGFERFLFRFTFGRDVTPGVLSLTAKVRTISPF